MRGRTRLSDDALDADIRGHVRTARRALGRAVDLCVRARRGQPRHLNRTAYQSLMAILQAVENVRSTVPPQVEDPDLYPEPMRDQVVEIEGWVRQANRAMGAARRYLERAEEAFNAAGATFAQEELDSIGATETELRNIVRSLESYRGLRAGRIEQEPIRRARQERRVAAPEPPPILPPPE